MCRQETTIDNGQPTAAYFDQLKKEDAWKTARFGEYPSGDIERDIDYTSSKLNAGETMIEQGQINDIPNT